MTQFDFYSSGTYPTMQMLIYMLDRMLVWLRPPPSVAASQYGTNVGCTNLGTNVEVTTLCLVGDSILGFLVEQQVFTPTPRPLLY